MSRRPQAEQSALLFEEDPYAVGQVVDVCVPELPSMKPWRGRIQQNDGTSLTVQLLTGPLQNTRYSIPLPKEPHV